MKGSFSSSESSTLHKRPSSFVISLESMSGLSSLTAARLSLQKKIYPELPLLGIPSGRVFLTRFFFSVSCPSIGPSSSISLVYLILSSSAIAMNGAFFLSDSFDHLTPISLVISVPLSSVVALIFSLSAEQKKI